MPPSNDMSNDITDPIYFTEFANVGTVDNTITTSGISIMGSLTSAESEADRKIEELQKTIDQLKSEIEDIKIKYQESRILPVTHDNHLDNIL